MSDDKDQRIAELETWVELLEHQVNRKSETIDEQAAKLVDYRLQRDRLAEALRSLTESAKAYMNYHGEKFYPASPDQVGGLWPAIRKAGGVLAELEEKR